MWKITLIVVGKLKESHWKDAQKEFLKRLKPFAKLTVKELPAEAISPTNPESRVKKVEAQRILDAIPPDSELIVALDEHGQSYTSRDFASLLTSESAGGAHLIMIIGGTPGLHESVLKRADKKIALSAMTFTHEMARVFLLEQIYRAATILAGKKYHY